MEREGKNSENRRKKIGKVKELQKAQYLKRDSGKRKQGRKSSMESPPDPLVDKPAGHTG